MAKNVLVWLKLLHGVHGAINLVCHFFSPFPVLKHFNIKIEKDVSYNVRKTKEKVCEPRQKKIKNKHI